uniref:Uncharacterized protein n=1 Tax=Gadus morhua TaxID=8049 RepID=A0A8C5BB69_GADMO
MFTSNVRAFHKPKMYRSLDGCCICRSSLLHECTLTLCRLSESRTGDICNACVLLVKRWKKLPVGSKKNWNHVSLILTTKKHSSTRYRPRSHVPVEEGTGPDRSAGSTTSSTSPAQSPSYSNLSDEGSDTDIGPGSSQPPVFSFLDLTYWKRQKVCCGIIYKGRFGEVLIDPHLFKPCCRKQQRCSLLPFNLPPSVNRRRSREEQELVDLGALSAHFVEDILGCFFGSALTEKSPQLAFSRWAAENVIS